PNSSGAAHLHYPIEVPPGRNAIQPDISLSYSSDSVTANGWLGVRWDLALSSIEVDTRFGVPRYDDGGQSEIYLLDGARLTRNPHGGGTFGHAAGARS